MESDLVGVVLRTNVAAAAAILAVLALRTPLAGRFGARAAYALWSVVPLAALASLLPARTVVVAPKAAAAPVAPGPVAEAVSAAPAAIAAAPGGAWSIEAALAPAWLIGALACLALLAWRQRQFGRSLGRLTREGGVYRAEAAGVGPALVGALRPRIVLPADFEERFTPAERAVVLHHERTHLRSGDHWVNALTALVQCLCWFNPLVHLGAYWLRLDQELACDATVVARFPTARKRYAEAMLKTQFAAGAAPLACHWPTRSAHPMKRRIAMLKSPPPSAGRRAAGLALAGIASLAAGVAAWAAQPPRIERGPEAQGLAPERRTAPAPARAQGFPSQVIDEALHEAIDEGYPDTIQAVLEMNPDVNHYIDGEGTPLVRAARLGDVQTARRLIARGADVNLAAPGDGNPLIAAAAHGRLEMVKLLVEAGADVNGYVRHDETPLINAARAGHLDVVRYLIDRGADPNIEVPSGNLPGETRTPLRMAANDQVAEYLRSRGARR